MTGQHELAPGWAVGADAVDFSNIATKTDLVETELRLIKWVIGVGVAAVLALTGVVWTATQVLLHAHP